MWYASKVFFPDLTEFSRIYPRPSTNWECHLLQPCSMAANSSSVRIRIMGSHHFCFTQMLLFYANDIISGENVANKWV